MRWLERHAWWGLLLMTVTMVGFGVGDVLQGAAADRGIPLGLTGLTLEELQAEGPASYRLFDFFTRVNGYSLLLAGLLGTAILLFAFRADQRWAWWTMWLLPLWAIGVAAFYLVAGVHAISRRPHRWSPARSSLSSLPSSCSSALLDSSGARSDVGVRACRCWALSAMSVRSGSSPSTFLGRHLRGRPSLYLCDRPSSDLQRERGEAAHRRGRSRIARLAQDAGSAV